MKISLHDAQTTIRFFSLPSFMIASKQPKYKIFCIFICNKQAITNTKPQIVVLKFDMFMRLLLTITLMLMASSLVCGQKYSSKSKRAIKRYKAGIERYDRRAYDQAEEEFSAAVRIDRRFIEAHLMLGQVYTDKRERAKAIESYRKAIAIDQDFYPKALFTLASLEQREGLYKEARDHFVEFGAYVDMRKKYADDIMLHIKQCEFALQALENPVPFNPVSLGEGINTAYDEYSPVLTVDENLLIFNRLIVNRGTMINNPYQEDFFVSLKRDSLWQKAEPVGAPLNTMTNEGALSISADAQWAYFMRHKWGKNYGGADIYYSERWGKSWSTPKNVGPPVSSRDWDSQPAISADGHTLYFVSNRPGGKGETDIWCCHLQADGCWGKAINLGDSINTPGAEQYPFIHPDNQTLYFTSDHWPGMGGFDIFMSRKKSDTQWTTPQNIGYPINTNDNETGIVVNVSGEYALFTSTRNNEQGRDIFRFDLPMTVKPLLTTYVHGIVYDKKTKEKLKAFCQLIDLESEQVVYKTYSDAITGDFLVCLPIERNYALNVSKEGYLFYSANFSLKGLTDISEPFTVDAPLQPIEIGKTVVLKNIFFDTDKYVLKPESFVELNKLLQFLNDNPKLKVEIGGHTDNVGTPDYNQELSENRARAVYDYLLTKGIEAERLTYKGYGLSQPIATNETEKGRAENRRTEFKIVGK